MKSRRGVLGLLGGGAALLLTAKRSAANCLRGTIKLGCQFVPWLRIWNYESRVSDQLVVLDDTGRGAIRGFAVVPPGAKYGWGGGFTCRADSPGCEGVGVSGYAETGVEGAGVWGANLFARSYHPNSNAHGTEISTGNFSGPTVINYGLFVVMEGLFANRAGVVVESSLAFPEGRPEIGMWIKENEHGNGARTTGLLVDHVDSGEAIRVQSGQRIALSSDGRVYVRYNDVNDKIEIIRRDEVVLSL